MDEKVSLKETIRVLELSNRYNLGEPINLGSVDKFIFDDEEEKEELYFIHNKEVLFTSRDDPLLQAGTAGDIGCALCLSLNRTFGMKFVTRIF